MRTVGELDDLLKQQGVPIIGVTLHKRGPPAISSIRFAPEATQQEMDASNAIREAFDWEGPSRIPDLAAMSATLPSRATQKAARPRTTKTRRKNHE